MGKRKRKPASQGTTISTLSSSQSSAPPQTTTMENPIHLVELKLTVKQKLTDQFIQKWYNLIATSSRGNLYGQFKMEFKLENYLLKLSPNERALITKLRCCNLKIPVETGRWVNFPREERICHLCHNDIGSEYHYIFECSFPNVVDIRKKHIPS